MGYKDIVLKMLRVMGLILFAFGGYLTYDYFTGIRKTSMTTAEVMSFNAKEQRPTISFKTFNNKRITLILEESDKHYAVGDVFLIRYDNAQLNEIHLVNDFDQWRGLAIAMIGLVLFLTSIIVTIKNRRR